MSTPADVLKDIIENITYNNYRDGNAPAVGIVGKKNLDGIPSDRCILLRNQNEEPVLTFNGERIAAGTSVVELEMRDPDPDERDDLMTDLEDGFKDSSYSITYTITSYNDVLSPYIKILQVKILL